MPRRKVFAIPDKILDQLLAGAGARTAFDPQLIAKYQRRAPGFGGKIVSMCDRGMSTQEIVGQLRQLYGIGVSPDLISVVTDAVREEIAAWQAGPLEAVYPLDF
jgi:putative transposase